MKDIFTAHNLILGLLAIAIIISATLIIKVLWISGLFGYTLGFLLMAPILGKILSKWINIWN